MGILSTLRHLFSKKETNKEVLARQATKQSQSKSSVKKNESSISNPTQSGDKSSITSPSSSTRNQTSSNGYNFRYKDGRRYHADAEVAYLLPNDDDEADRVHQQHWILRYALQGNFSSPIIKELTEGINVLDSGCGPATWTFEMGEAYPRSKFYGIDASCVFPEKIMPANVEFVIGNIAKDIPYENNFFDFIHQRLLVFGLTDEDWTNTFQQLFRVLKPGGYIELAEPNVEELFESGPAMNLLQVTLTNMLNSRNIPLTISVELEERLIKAGFVDVVIKVTGIPLNHGGKVGELLWADYKHVYNNTRHAIAMANPDWEDPAVYSDHIDKCGEESRESKTHLKWYSVYARKPETKNEE